MRIWFVVLALTVAAPAVILADTAPAQAQSGCKAKKKKSPFGSILGDMVGRFAADKVGSTGIGGGYLPTNKLNEVLADSIACALAPDEREAAADATNRVVERRVGATESWQSESRPEVSGSSTVTAVQTVADGSICKDVRDVATIDGEERTITKRMCRAPGQSAYKMQTAAA